MRSLAGKVVVITGASAGIGRALAIALAPFQVKLVLGARRVDRLEAVAQTVRAAGSDALAVACDVASRGAVDALAAAAVEHYGRMDVMVANAGYGLVGRLEDLTDEQFDDIVAVNVKGTLYAMQAAVRQMRTQAPDSRGRRGHIIAVSSAAGRRGLPLFGVYAMTKAAQLSLCEALRVELKDAAIAVSSVHPISTTTEFFDVASEKSRIRARGMGTTQSAETVARKMVRLMAHPKPELWPHGASRLALVMAALMPGLADRMLGGMLPRRKA